MRRLIRSGALVAALVVGASWVPAAGAIVGGTDQVGDGFAAPIAYIQVDGPSGSYSCTGSLISATVVMTAAHCVYDLTKAGNLVGVAQPGEISVRVGSRNIADASLGVDAGVVAVLPQPYYRWDNSRHLHDIALLALDRPMTQAPVTLAEQTPDAGKPMLIAGYGLTSTTSAPTGLPALRAGLIAAADPASCALVDETFDPAWLFCGAAMTDPTVPGGGACYGDSGGPAFAYENTLDNLVVEGVISYGTRTSCEFSRTYLVLVSSERGFIDRALATPPQFWYRLRDDPPTALVKATTRRIGQAGILSLRINDDHSARSWVDIGFYSHKGKRLSHTFRGVPTNRWVRFSLTPSYQPFSGYVCAQGTDSTNKPSNFGCGVDIIN
jgi:hypothetical protein